jgi:hypothetical protein
VDYELNPEAENLRWIPKINGRPLYLETIKGKSKRWIDSRIMNRITAPVEGTPVWPMFVEETHVAKQVLKYNPGHPLYVGLDFGRTPAAVIGQIINDRWVILGEVIGNDMGATTFAPIMRRWLFQNCPGLVDGDSIGALEEAVRASRLRLYGDPKGQDKTQADEQTAYDVFRDHGLRVTPAPIPSNSIQTRIEAVEFVLNGMRDGMPRFLLSPNCRTLKMGMAGGYHFKKGDAVKAEPAKNRYSHPCDGLQYLILGAGEGRVMIGRERPASTQSAPVQTRTGRRSLRRI